MGKHAASDTPRRPGWFWPAIGVLVLALLASGGWWLAGRGGDTATAGRSTGSPGGDGAGSATSTCASSPAVSVVVVPTLLEPVRAAADSARQAGACATYTVEAAPPVTTAAAVVAGTAPTVWIPDSTAWARDVAARSPATKLTTGPSIATSPLVLAVPPGLSGSVSTAPTWAGLLGGAVPVQFADPTRSSASRLAIAAAASALGTGDQARLALGGAMIKLSRTAAESEDALFARVASGATPAAAFPASEAAVAAYNSAHAGSPLAATIPGDGTAAFDHPFLTLGPPDAPTSAGVAALLAALQSPAGIEAMGKAGLRSGPSDATAKVSTIVGGPPTYLPPPPAEAASALERSWTAVRTEMKMLAVVDVSGSMREPAGPTTRIALAHQAGLVALAAFPPGSTIGLWRFGYELGGPGQDWQEIVPQRPLTADAGGKDQKAALAEGFARIAAEARGFTGLYDTMLAAYRTAQAGYDPSKVNSVVLLTDGRDERDPNSMGLDALLAQLRQLRDPARPIVVITVAIGPDADVETLKRITATTGGRSYQATAPEQITAVFVDALLGRAS